VDQALLLRREDAYAEIQTKMHEIATASIERTGEMMGKRKPPVKKKRTSPTQNRHTTRGPLEGAYA